MMVCSMTRFKVKVTSPWKSEIGPFSKAVSSPMYKVGWQMTTDCKIRAQFLQLTGAGFLIFVLVFCVTWLWCWQWVGVDHQSRTVLIYYFLVDYCCHIHGIKTVSWFSKVMNHSIHIVLHHVNWKETNSIATFTYEFTTVVYIQWFFYDPRGWRSPIISFPNSHPEKFPLLSSRQHLSCGDCLEISRENNQNCSVLCCVQLLFTMICKRV